MTSTVAVLGASGVYGRHLVPRLVARGHRVRALVRRPQAAGLLAACGAELGAADIFDAASLQRGLEGCDVVVNLATAVPRPGTASDLTMNDRIRRDGVPILLGACREARVPRLLQQSIAMIHAGSGGALVDEPSPLPEGRYGAATRDMEASVRQSDLDWITLRGGLFYGPGAGRDDEWRTQARAGTLKLPAEGDDYVSLIHVADMADATVAALERWPSRRVFLVVDDRPAQWRDVLAHAALLAGGAAPLVGGPAVLPSFRVSNRRLRQELSWAPRYADYRVGLAC